MHVGLQGLVKNQWYGQWIKGNALRAPTPVNSRELGMMHEFLGTVSVFPLMRLQSNRRSWSFQYGAGICLYWLASQLVVRSLPMNTN
jgi:hypothetical protein